MSKRDAVVDPAVRKRLHLVSYNIWHGLAGQGIFKFREFETPTERRLRRSSLLQVIQRQIIEVNREATVGSSVVVALQEVNPLFELGPYLLSRLSCLTAGFALDQSGVRLKGVGLPVNLQTGLATGWSGELVHASEFSEPLQLSGPRVPLSPELSVQFEEIRVARVDVFRQPEMGSIAVVNLHLHHGFGRFPELIKRLDLAVERETLTKSEFEQIHAQLLAAEERRVGELKVLLAHLSRVAKHCDFIFLMGDFNTLPESLELNVLREAGFIDLTSSVGPSWDPVRNPRPHALQDGFEYPLPHFNRPTVRSLYREFDLLPRTIDFIWMKKQGRAEAHIRDVRLLGLDRAQGSLFTDQVSPSDHFGLAVDLEFVVPQHPRGDREAAS